MRGRGDDCESVLLREPGDDAAQARDVRASFLDVAANTRAHFHHRLDHFRLDLFAEKHLAFFEYLGDVRAQLARLRINYLKFLFDAERELIEHLPSQSNNYGVRCFAIICQSGLTLPKNSWRKC